MLNNKQILFQIEDLKFGFIDVEFEVLLRYLRVKDEQIV